MVIQAVGYVGSAGAAVMWVPQAVRAWSHRRNGVPLDAISPLAYSVAIVFNTLLLAYGLLNHAHPVVLAGVVNLVCAAVIVAALLLPRRKSA